ncbi:hypothetical protein BsWGS_20093 [Bradybaena similaris]
MAASMEPLVALCCYRKNGIFLDLFLDLLHETLGVYFKKDAFLTYIQERAKTAEEVYSQPSTDDRGRVAANTSSLDCSFLLHVLKR